MRLELNRCESPMDWLTGRAIEDHKQEMALTFRVVQVSQAIHVEPYPVNL